MSRMAAVGDKTSVLAFGALGVDTYAVSEDADAKEAWEEIIEKDYGVVFITERFHRQLEKEVAKFAEQLTPAVLIIPGPSGSTGLGLQRLKRIVEMAVGADILAERKSKV